MRLALLALSAVACGPGAASAAVTGVAWRFVDNTVGNPQADSFVGPMWAQPHRLFTLDLILLGDAGQRVNGVNMGDAAFPNAAPFAIHTNAPVFNHPVGGNTRSAAFENVQGFNAIRYDTFVALGGAAPGPSISFAGGADLSGAGGALRATWFTTDEALLDANGEMRILRITLNLAGFGPGDSLYLGTDFEGQGPLSSIEIGLPGGVLTTLTVPDAFIPPTPGATALLGIAGAAGLRRRRAESHLFTQKQLIGG